ncbi:uncharacterized protein LOC129729467 isoform X2 [Wyeomyia smithii]|uniref:uncharacterized protein LOC129729467 isoform X2 n=1 Tax=Wyeomyia smithii TaxID=174621 RepID=UPI002467B254|nr:uncharacterized protein LOC129729467 isoform X2 [Wyeomyia smithii]
MFVMLSVRTTATVRERPAETVKKAININQIIKNINNRKGRKSQQQQQKLNNAKQIDCDGRKNSNNTSVESDNSNSSNNITKSNNIIINNSIKSDQKNQRRDKNSYQQPIEKIDKPSIQFIAPRTTITTTTTSHGPGRLVQTGTQEEQKHHPAGTVSVLTATTNPASSETEKQDPQNEQQQQQQQQGQLTKTKFLLPELNNYRKPPTVQVPVATILNDLSPVPAPAKVTNKVSNSNPMSPMNPAGLQSNSPDVKAMRYYRLWIYTCNAVLLMAVIVFCGVAGKILLSDYRRLLVTGLSLTQPSFIYAYLALLVQSGFLQLIGCLGALRLSEKLLNAYWLLLLVLLIGDAMLGIFWMFKFDRVMNDLQPMLRNRLAHEYGNSIELTDLWDRLQNEGRCCGVSGPQDFPIHVNRTYPDSCCASDVIEQISISRRPLASAVVFRGEDLDDLAASSAAVGHNFSDISDAWSLITAPSSSISSSSVSGSLSSSSSSGASGGSFSIRSSSSSVLSATGGGSDNGAVRTITACRAVYPQGCADRIVSWLRHTADVLFVLGYCVIAFLKLCFLGILRYEIKEMIQKIKLLQTEMAGAILNGVDCDQQQIQQQVTSTSINGGIHAEPKVGNRDRERTRIEAAESERESLLNAQQQQQQQLQQEPTPKLLKHRQLYTCINEQHLCSGSGNGGGGTGGGSGNAAVGGCESDTNSNCALLVEDNSSSLLSSTAGANKTINGNNNYELNEFDSKAPTYSLVELRGKKTLDWVIVR